MEVVEKEQIKISVPLNHPIQNVEIKETNGVVLGGTNLAEEYSTEKFPAEEYSTKKFPPCTDGGCDDDFCVPRIVRHGFLGSIWTWIAVILTVAVIWMSVALLDTNSEWYQSLNKPTALISGWGFVLIWSILYIGLIITIIMAAWNEDNPRSGCMILLYVLIILLTLCWIIAFMQFHMMGLGIAILVLILVLTLWLMWLVSPPRNSSGGWFPHIFLWIFFFWIIIALYYNIAFLVLNPDA